MLGVSGGGGCNKLIGEHQLLRSGSGKKPSEAAGKGRSASIWSCKPQPGRHRHILPPTLPADRMDATIIDERLAGFDLALGILRGRGIGPLPRRPRRPPNAWIDAAGPDTGGHPYVGGDRVCAGQRKLCKVELRYLAEPLARVRAKLATWSGRRRGVFTGERASINAATGVGQRTRSQ